MARAPAIEGLLAVAAAGSWVDGRIDEHSDLDLVLVTEPGQWLGEADRRLFASECGALRSAICGKQVGEPRLLLCLFGEPVLHVDLVFVELPDLTSLGQAVEALYVSPDAPALNWPTPRERRPLSAQWCEDRAWLSLHYLTTKTARGELHEVLSALNWFRNSILVSLLTRVHGPVLFGLRRIEQSGIPELAALARTTSGYDKADLIRAIRECFALYLDLRERTEEELTLNSAAEADMREFFQAHLGVPLELGPTKP